MSFEEFQQSLDRMKEPPVGFSLPLQALWHDAQGNWDRAHECAQQASDRNGAWVHAYLHRKEGDAANAGYWYSRAGKPRPYVDLDEEREAIVRALLEM